MITSKRGLLWLLKTDIKVTRKDYKNLKGEDKQFLKGYVAGFRDVIKTIGLYDLVSEKEFKQLKKKQLEREKLQSKGVIAV